MGSPLLKMLKSAKGIFPSKQEQILNENHKLLKLENEKKRLEIEKEKKLLGAR